MPDGMVERQLARYIEDDPQRVAPAAYQHPNQEAKRNRSQERLDRNYHHPSHEQIGDDGEPFELAHRKDFEQNTHDGKPPDDAKKSPAPAPAHSPDSHRRISSGYQQKDGRVIQYPKEAFDLWLREGVIERGREEERDHRCTIDAKRHHLPDVADLGGIHHEDDESGDREPGTYAMGDSICKLLRQALLWTQRDAIQKAFFTHYTTLLSFLRERGL